MKTIIAFTAFIALILSVIWGYIDNVLTVVQHLQAGAELTILFALQVVGLFVFPIGVLLGWIL